MSTFPWNAMCGLVTYQPILQALLTVGAFVAIYVYYDEMSKPYGQDEETGQDNCNKHQQNNKPTNHEQDKTSSNQDTTHPLTYTIYLEIFIAALVATFLTKFLT